MVDVELSRLLRRVVNVVVELSRFPSLVVNAAVELSRLFNLEEMVLCDNVQEAMALYVEFMLLNNAVYVVKMTP